MSPPFDHAPSDPGTDQDTDPLRVLLLMNAEENRRLLTDRLERYYSVTARSDVDLTEQAFDLCIVDNRHFERYADALLHRKDHESPVFLPILLLTEATGSRSHDPAVWEVIDDILEKPIHEFELRGRLDNLVQRRHMSSALAERERALEASIAELDLKERAIDAAPVGVVLTDPHQPDNPAVYANASFERITGYDHEEIIGKNMRMLLGAATDDASVAALREAIDRQESVSTTLVNYRKDGTRFWNRVELAPVYDDRGDLTNFVGFLTDVTEEKVREQRLSVLNRLMRHNLSNDLNIIDGYAETLLEEVEDPRHREWIREVKRAAESLIKLGQDVSRIERILGHCRAFERPIDVGRSLEEVAAGFAERYPAADITVDVIDGPWYVAGNCLEEAFTELVENAILHQESDVRKVRVTVAPDESSDRIQVRIVDDGLGVPVEIREMLEEGKETPLKHGDGLGLWLASWVVTLVGGGIELDAGHESGTAVTLTLPTVTGPVP